MLSVEIGSRAIAHLLQAFVVSRGEYVTEDNGVSVPSDRVEGVTMKEVGFYEISRGEPPVRMGTGTLAQVRRMEHPACYLCLHGVLGTDQPMLWANMGVAVFDEVSGRFKDKKQKGLGRHGAPLSFVLRATPQIYGALAVVRAFAEVVDTTKSAHWFAIDAAHDQVTPLAKRDAWNALGCATSSDVWEEVSYLSVKGPQDDLHLLFDRITRNLQEEQRQTEKDADAR